MNLTDLTEDTLAELAGKWSDAQASIAKSTAGLLSATGDVGFLLDDLVSLVPVNTPTYDTTPRVAAAQGSVAATWRALLNENATQPNPFVGLDAGGALVNLGLQTLASNFMPVRVSGEVTRDAVALARNYNDAKAVASIQTLMQWRIQDNKALIGGQAYALPAMGTVTVTTATTGGTIPLSTAIWVKVAARSSYNYFWGGSNVASAQGTVTSGAGTSTNTATATWAAVKGAAAYDVYAGATTGGTYYYVTTVSAPTVTLTSVPTVNVATVPTTLPNLFQTAPTAVPVSDTSYSANAYNGYFASILGDYATSGFQVTPGTATPSGAIWTDNAGGALTGNAQGITQIDAMNIAIYNQAQLSPNRMLMNVRVAQEIGQQALGTNAAVTYLQPTDSDRNSVTVGLYAARYINRATGESLEITVDPWIPDGQILFLTDRIPYPESGIASTFTVATLQEVTQFDYGVQLGGAGSGPRDVWDQSSIETLINRAPVACGVLSGIG